MITNDTGTTAPAAWVALPRPLLEDAVAHVAGARFDHPGHHLAPELRHYLNAKGAAPTIAHATDTQRPVTDQRTLAQLLRTLPYLVHVGELPRDAGQIITQLVMPHVTSDQWNELVQTIGTHHDLDHAVMSWEEFNADLPAQHEHRQAVATDIAERDVEVLIWVLLNPGETRCEDCIGPAERMATALPRKTVCGLHLTKRSAQVAAMRARDAGQQPGGGA